MKYLLRSLLCLSFYTNLPAATVPGDDGEQGLTTSQQTSFDAQWEQAAGAMGLPSGIAQMPAPASLQKHKVAIENSDFSLRKELQLNDAALPEDEAALILMARMTRRGHSFSTTLKRLYQLCIILQYKKDLGQPIPKELLAIIQGLLEECLGRCKYLYNAVDRASHGLCSPYAQALPDVQEPLVMQQAAVLMNYVLDMSLALETTLRRLQIDLPTMKWFYDGDKTIKNKIYTLLPGIVTENTKLHGVAREGQSKAMHLYQVKQRDAQLQGIETTMRREASRLAGWHMLSWFLPPHLHGIGTSRSVRQFAKEVGPLPSLPTVKKLTTIQPNSSPIARALTLGACASAAGLCIAYVRVRSLTTALLAKGQWSSWKGKASLPDLLAMPERQLQDELVKLINRTYAEEFKEGDIFMPIFAFIDDIDAECARLYAYTWWHGVLSALRLDGIVTLSNKILREADSRLERLELLRSLVVSWMLQTEA